MGSAQSWLRAGHRPLPPALHRRCEGSFRAGARAAPGSEGVGEGCGAVTDAFMRGLWGSSSPLYVVAACVATWLLKPLAEPSQRLSNLKAKHHTIAGVWQWP